MITYTDDLVYREVFQLHDVAFQDQRVRGSAASSVNPNITWLA